LILWYTDDLVKLY